MERIATYEDFVGELTVIYRRTKLPTERVTTAEEASNYMRPYFDTCMDNHEEVKVLHLNRNNNVVNVHHVSSGSDNASIVPVKDIMRNAILIKTSAIILFHNHPSGSLKPSKADHDVTAKLKKASALMEVPLLDSIILTREGYYSFQNEGVF
ncbi:JAB domain-containing protein [Flagellimonas onchidii]|uniref:JAB domain-containing protein n=1 Tax=Flagellimonas onchidii TaxID=2562684 RepID=UPI0010A65E20|nr:JAB domain-containing protein [Allomuricauda onchidii]